MNIEDYNKIDKKILEIYIELSEQIIINKELMNELEQSNKRLNMLRKEILDIKKETTAQ